MSTVTHEQALQIAIQHHGEGRLAEAEQIYRQLLELYPQNPDLWHLLGVIEGQTGRQDSAVARIRQAVSANPQSYTFRNNLGMLLTEMGRFEEAVAELTAALSLESQSAPVHYNLGIAYYKMGRAEEAVAAYREAIRLSPTHRLAKLNLGNALVAASRPDEAIAFYEAALAQDPSYTDMANNLGNFLKDRARVDEAIAWYRRALEFAPHDAVAHSNLGTALKDLGDIKGALESYRYSLAADPDRPEVRSNLIFVGYFDPAMTEERMAEEYRTWERLHAQPLRSVWRPHELDRSPERKLRIGYVSPDFRDHVVGRTLLPCFQAHDRERFEIYCYSGVMQGDAYTEDFRRGCTGWRETVNWSDEVLAEQIRADEIDILIDLALHTAYNRLLTFARKPAPVQMAWLGYPGTTGLSAIDYRITDSFLEPEGTSSPALFEEPLRLARSWCCYCVPEGSPDVAELPARAGEGVTFGSFNNFAKINKVVLALWARVLAAVPRSRLLLVLKGNAREQARRAFLEQGIEGDRIEFLDYYPTQPVGASGRQTLAYLERYHRVDIALDPFPYNGMTTTCDALWMGVPVVALIGQTPMSRASYSLLSNVGLGELAAANAEAYVDLAAKLAADVPRLAELRATMRARLAASPLLDAAGLTRDLEGLYRTAWRRWCARPVASLPA